MPSFVISTTVSKDRIPPNFLKETSALVAKTLGKPESYVVVQVIPDQIMSWGGATGPCGLATLMSIGALGVQENKKHSAVLHEHIEKSLGIPKDKFYITYQNSDKSAVGYAGTTFHDLL